MNAAHNLQESSSPGKSEVTTKFFFIGISTKEKNRKRSPSTFLGNPARKRTEQAVVWTELLLLGRFEPDPVNVENRSQQTSDAGNP